MGSQKLSRGRFGGRCLGCAVALGLIAFGCAPDYVTNNSAPVNFYVAGVTASSGAAVLDSDVRSGSSQYADGSGPLFVCEDYATVDVAVRNKNPLGPTPNAAEAVIVDSYVVRYFRTDGRGVEGVDVPYRITGSLTAQVDVATSGTTGIPIEVVRHQAKSEPPLSTIEQTVVLTMFAEVTLYGKTIAGERVSGSGRLQINFADFGDDLTACEGL